MFDGCLFYDPSNMFYYEPLKRFLNVEAIDSEKVQQFIAGIPSMPLQKQNLMQLDKKTGIATIPIKGALMPTANPIMQMIGGTSTSEVNNSVQQAIEDKGIKGVLFKANSGGGSAGGIDETAEKIAELSSKKPVFTHVNGQNGSACYYLTSQSNKIFANGRTNQIGSIGTKLVMNDTSEQAKQAGIKPIVIATGKNKSIGAFGVPITQDQQELVQSMVNELQGFFEQTVLRKRPNIDIKQVNDGRSFFAYEAVNNGLIDGIKSEKTVKAMLRATVRR
jgi:protease-4